MSVFANSGGQFSCVSTLEKVNFQLTSGGPVEIEATAPRFPRMHAYVDIAVVIVVLVGTNLIAHFTTAWASIATVPISALVLLALTKRRGNGGGRNWGCPPLVTCGEVRSTRLLPSAWS